MILNVYKHDTKHELDAHVIACALLNGHCNGNYDSLKVSKLPHHLISSDAYEWRNERIALSMVHIYIL